MALKALMLRRNIEAKAAELEALQAKAAEFSARETELTASIDEADTVEARTAVEAEIDRYETELHAHQEAVASANAELEQLRAQLTELENQKPAAPVRADIKNERMNTSMDLTKIRTLPKNQRVVEAMFPTEAARKELVEGKNVADFLARVRELGKTKAAVSGADLMVPVEILPLITENMFRYSKLLNRVNVISVAGEARQPIAGLVQPAVWTDCCAAINELTFNFGVWPMNCWMLAGYVTICNSTLQDSAVNLLSALVEMISMALGLGKDAAILYGDGNGKPLGILPRLAQESQPADYPTTALPWEDLHSTNLISISASLTGAEFWAALRTAAGNTFSRYSRGNLFWAMNSKTYAALESKAIATTVTGEWVAIIGGRLPIISGDIDVLEFIPDGDIIGGYGELYTYAQREGVELGVDTVGFTNRVKNQTLIYGKERGDGAPIVPRAFVGININGSAVTTTFNFPGDVANNADLASLAIGETLSPTFDADVTSYTATASNASDAVTAIADDADAQVVVEYDGAQILNGFTVTWTTGTKNLVVTVKKGNAVKVYTVAVTKSA